MAVVSVVVKPCTLVTLHRRHDGEPIAVKYEDVKTVTSHHFGGGAQIELFSGGMVLVSETCQEAVAAFKEARADQNPAAPRAIPSPWEEWEYSGQRVFVSQVSADPPQWLTHDGMKGDRYMYDHIARTGQRIS